MKTKLFTSYKNTRTKEIDDFCVLNYVDPDCEFALLRLQPLFEHNLDVRYIKWL